MSGDSPTAELKDNFNYSSPGRSTPPATTSFIETKQEVEPIITNPSTAAAIAGGDLTAIPAIDENKEDKDKEKKDESDFSSPDANPGYKHEDRGDGVKRDPGKDDKGDSNKMNGTDKLDGQWKRPLDAKPTDDESDDDNCVKCLYYTMQCCECTIT